MQLRLWGGLLALALVLTGCEKAEEKKSNLEKQVLQDNTAAVEVTLKKVQVALEQYYAEHTHYPESLDLLIKGGQLEKANTVDPWGTPLSYRRPEPGKYVLKSLGPDKREGGDDISLKQL